MNFDKLLSLLPWLLPPFIGALIGYITNAIAIRMLFRPLKEIKFLGVKLPFTPGVIPKQRHQLAESIGRMVSRELITEEAIEGQLSSEKFQIRLGQNIEALVHDLLNKTISELQSENREVLFKSIEKFLSDSLFKFFSSRSFIHAARKLITALVQSLSEKQLSEVLGQVNAQDLVSRLIPLLTGPEPKRKIIGVIRNWLQEKRRQGPPLSEVLPEELMVSAAGVISTLLPLFFEYLFRWLKEESTRAELQVRGKRLLRDILDKLNLFQKFIISAAQYDTSLEQKMPEIVDEALSTLEAAAYEPENQLKIKLSIEKALLKWRTKDSAELISSLDGIPLESLIGKVLLIFKQEHIQKKIADSLERLISDQNRRTLKELLARYFGVQEQDVIESASFQLLNYLSKKESSRFIAAEIVAFGMRILEEEQDNTIANLLHIEESAQIKVAAYLTGKLISILEQRLPMLIRSFDIQGLVVTKINRLDVAEVEKLLLMVISRHLKWINLFGAILGALIGLSQVVLRIFR